MNIQTIIDNEAARAAEDAKLAATRARMDAKLHQEEAAARAKAEAHYALVRELNRQTAEAMAAQAAQQARVRTMLGGSTVERVAAALCDALDRIAALEAKLA